MKTFAPSPAAAVRVARRSGAALAALACSATLVAKAEDALDRTPAARSGPSPEAVPLTAGELMAALPPDLPDQRRRSGPPIDKESEAVLVVGSADELVAAFEALGFSYRTVRDEGVPVPRVLVASLPDDLEALQSVRLRKSVFFNTMLPIVQRVNESIRAERARLFPLRARLAAGEAPAAADRDWLDALAGRYEVDDGDLDDLAVRVDIVPPSMVLAMAALESGWGTSGIARSGNTLFGQITTAADGMASSTGHVYARFDSLYDSTAAYARNLNTHPARRRFRALRAARRAVDGAMPTTK